MQNTPAPISHMAGDTSFAPEIPGVKPVNAPKAVGWVKPDCSSFKNRCSFYNVDGAVLGSTLAGRTRPFAR